MAVVPDNLPNDLKVTALSPSAFRLWVLARCFCSTNRTDGVIPAPALRTPLGARARDVTELVDSGMWHRLQSGGFVDQDYLMDNPASTDEDEQREAVAKRVRKHRHKRRCNALHGALQPPLQEPLQMALHEALPEVRPPSDSPSLSGSSGSVGISYSSPDLPKPSSEADQVARAGGAGGDSGRKARPKRLAKPVPFPADYQPTEKQIQFASEHGLLPDLELLIVACAGHFEGQLVRSPAGRFTTWLAKEAQFRRERARRGGPGANRADTQLERQMARVRELEAEESQTQ